MNCCTGLISSIIRVITGPFSSHLVAQKAFGKSVTPVSSVKSARRAGDFQKNLCSDAAMDFNSQPFSTTAFRNDP